MKLLPDALSNLVEAFQLLPGVGPRTAERFAYYLLKNDSVKSSRLSEAINQLSRGVKLCPITFALIDSKEDISSLYDAPNRQKTTVLIVADPFDVIAIEKTGNYEGTYHVLGGLISPIDGITPDTLRIDELKKRVHADGVNELILATNASVEGESTAYYIAKQFDKSELKITRLAQGLPIGLDIEYADQITLGKALEGRRAI